MKYTADSLQLMNFFEAMTGSKLKNYFEWKNYYIFVVEPGEMGKAIGKNGKNVLLLQEKLKKRIKIVEYSPELKTFINNLVSPLRLKSVQEINNIAILTPETTQERAILIGKNASSLKEMESIVKNYFKIEQIKILQPWETNQEESGQETP